MLPGILFALLTSVSWALANVFIQRSGNVMGAPRSLLYALIVGALASLGAAFFLDHPTEPLAPSHFAWLGVAGVFGLLGYAGMFLAFEKADLTVSVPVVSSWSMVAAAFSVFVLGERPDAHHYVGVALVCAGVLTVAIASTRSAANQTAEGRRTGIFAVVSAAAGAVGFGIMIPTFGFVSPALGAFGASAAVYASCVVLGIPLALLTRQSLALPPRGSWNLVVITGLAETVGFVAIALGRRYAPITVVAPVSSLAATITVIYAWAVLRQRQSVSSLAGGVLVCVGVVVLAL